MSDLENETKAVREFARDMTDAELRDTATRLRGTAKRGRRRTLTEAETLALAAVIEEQDRRAKHGVSQ